MYLQITTKCNMSCAHCCFSCSMRGKHGNYQQILENMAFAASYGNDTITIGGGEPTLHPQFFDILRECLNDFYFVWMATNGSQTEKMNRLYNILTQQDYPECDCIEEHGEEMFEQYGCLCHEKMDDDSIYQENKLTVALSQDYFHDDINPNILRLWQQNFNRRSSGFEIRNVTQSHDGVAAAGRAIKTSSGWSNHCACSDFILKPNGKIKLCGCSGAPIIGNTYNGISEEWENIIQSDDFLDTNCWQSIKNKTNRPKCFYKKAA